MMLDDYESNTMNETLNAAFFVLGSGAAIRVVSLVMFVPGAM